MSYHNSHASSTPYVPKTTGNGRIKFTHKFEMQHPRHSLKRLEIGGLPALELERMTTHFYTAFLNDTLDKFIGRL